MSECDVCLRSEGGVCPSCAPAEIERLRSALETVKQERDEARKLAEVWRDEAEVPGAWSLELGGLHPWECREENEE